MVPTYLPLQSLKKLLLVVAAVVLLLYPFLLYLGLQVFEPRAVSIVLLAIALGRIWLLERASTSKLAEARPILWIMVASLSLSTIFNDSAYLLINPAITFLALAIFFFSTFISPPNFAERMARLDFPEGVPPAARSYCAIVTSAWVMFFLFNAAVSLWTAFYSDLQVWTLYNGVIVWILMGAMFAVEFLIRTFMDPVFKRSKEKQEKENFSTSMMNKEQV